MRATRWSAAARCGAHAPTRPTVRALLRLAAIAVAGAALYYAGLLNSIVIQRPERPGAVEVVIAIGIALGMLAGAVRGDGRGDGGVATKHVRLHRAVWLFICVMGL